MVILCIGDLVFTFSISLDLEHDFDSLVLLDSPDRPRYMDSFAGGFLGEIDLPLAR